MLNLGGVLTSEAMLMCKIGGGMALPDRTSIRLYRARLKGDHQVFLYFVAAVAYHICLALPAAYTQPGDHLFACPVALPAASVTFRGRMNERTFGPGQLSNQCQTVERSFKQRLAQPWACLFGGYSGSHFWLSAYLSEYKYRHKGSYYAKQCIST